MTGKEGKRLGAAMQQSRLYACGTTRALFLRPDGVLIPKLDAQQHNEWTACLFATYLFGKHSEETGQPFAGSTVDMYVSTVLAEIGRTVGFNPIKHTHRLKHIIRNGQKSAASPAGMRRKRQGIRHEQLKSAAGRLGGPREGEIGGKNELNLWAEACTAPILFLIGGEVQHLRHCDVTHTVQVGRRCLLVEVLAIKKANAINRPRHPLLVPEMENDLACAYTAIMRLLRKDPEGRPRDWGSKDTSPLFRVRSKKLRNMRPVRTLDMNKFAKRIARENGLKEAEFSGHSFRIGRSNGSRRCGRHGRPAQSEGPLVRIRAGMDLREGHGGPADRHGIRDLQKQPLTTRSASRRL